MHAAVVPVSRRPSRSRIVDPRPATRPGPGQDRASGLCHTDIHAARGDWPVKPKIPLIPGHEGVGTIETLGEGVDTLTVGDRVALPWLGDACGHCRYCVAGWETYCTSPQYMGYTMDGSYAEYAVGNASHVVARARRVSSLDAAPLTCAGVTTYKALKVAHPHRRDRHGRGHRWPGPPRPAVRQDLRHHHRGGRRDDAKLQLAKDLGADHVVDARGDQVAAI